MPLPTQADRDDIESIMDRTSLADLLEAIATICHEKADHLASTWQDKNAASTWTRDAKKLERLSAKVES